MKRFFASAIVLVMPFGCQAVLGLGDPVIDGGDAAFDAAFERKPVTDTAPTDDAKVEAGPDNCAKPYPGAVCGLTPQCGCTSKETCDIADTSGSVHCVAAGLAPIGAPCVTTSGCRQGLTCVFGTCHELCQLAGATCQTASKGECTQVNAPGGAPIPNFKVCRVECDVRDPTACGGITGAGSGVCMVDDQGRTDCAKGGTRGEDEACTPADECAPGLVCTTSAGNNTCKRWCRVGEATDCTVGTCRSFSTKVIIRGVEHGVCA